MKLKQTIENGVNGLNSYITPKVQTGMAFAALTLANPTFAFADSKISVKAPTVDKSGNVTYQGGGTTDPQKAVTKVLENGQFWVAVVAAVASLLLIGTGIWQGFKASKLKMEGNPEAYKMASNVAIGAVIGGLLMGSVAAFLAIGVAQGNDFFKGGS